MEDCEKIGIAYKNYRKNVSKKTKPLQNSTLEQYWNDIKFVLEILDTNIVNMYSNKDSFDKYMKKFKEYVNSNGLKKCTLSSYKSDCENFYKFWQKYREKETDKKNNSYKKLIISYLNEHGKATIDEIFYHISTIKTTGKTGKKYLREVVTKRYKGSEIFGYKNPYIWLKNNLQKEELDNIISENISEAFEGELKERTFLSKTRNQQIVNMVKQRDSYKCIACNFHYNNKIVQAHHLIPLKDKQAGVVKADDLITLCPTCHALAHVLIKTDATYQNRTKLIKKLRAIVLNK